MRFNIRHLLPLALLSLGCGVETPCANALAVNTGSSQQSQAVLSSLGCMVSAPEVRQFSDFTREQVKDDIYHYSARLQVGPDAAHDVIVLHRVVRERAAWQPATGSDNAFLVHGDAWGFQAAFMSSTLTTTVPRDQSFAVYLAQQGVDVWGIDERWTQVPLQTTDFSFMKDWSLATHAKDVSTGLSVARQVRALTGGSSSPMNLLGWSRGAQVAYAVVNGETRLPAAQRQVSGFIPVDMVLKFGPDAAAQRQAACVRAQVGEYVLSLGRYEGNLAGPGAGLSILAVGQGARTSPTTTAPAPLPPLPYGQLAVALGAATFNFLTDAANNIQPPVPYYHFSAGKFAADGSLLGLQLVKEAQFFDFLSTANPYQDLRQQVEGDELMCDSKDLPYDDYLKDVKVPVLYVGAGGGFGSYGEYTVKNLLGSRDVTVLRAQFLPDAQRFADYGHTDPWLASDAKTRVWDPIAKWVKKH